MITRWALQWRSENQLDGVRRYIMWDKGETLFFDTRKEAREHRDRNYGYIKKCRDLQEEPHGWQVPKVVKIEIILRVIE